jgi:small-conductance mechanosensitive channel
LRQREAAPAAWKDSTATMPTPPPPSFDRVSERLRIPTEETRALVRRPRFRVALVTGIGALAVLIAGSTLKGWHWHTPAAHVVVEIAAPLGFLVLAVACVRATAGELDALIAWRGGHSAGQTVRMVVTVVGYFIALLLAVGLTSYPLGHLLLGGAILGVILGIAAQQSLGNVFSGLVLLFARPFTIGNHIRVRSGALGGEFYGTVLSMSLTYVTISTVDGILKVPNSSVLASAVGPFPSPDQAHNPGTVARTPAAAPPMAEDDTTLHHGDGERRRVASSR